MLTLSFLRLARWVALFERRPFFKATRANVI